MIGFRSMGGAFNLLDGAVKFNIALEIFIVNVSTLVKHTFKSMHSFLWRAFWRVFSISDAIALSKMHVFLDKEARTHRARASIWRENLESISKVECNIDYPELMRRRRLLESAFYHSDAELAAMMADCAAKLSIARNSVIDDGFVPVFAPFHFCSDIIATIIATMVPPIRCHAYSIYEWDYFASCAPGQVERLNAFKASLPQCHPDAPSAQQRALFKELRAGLANVLIFPDILPQFTSSFLGRVMRTCTVRLFERNARLHCGVEEIARIAGGKTGGKIIPYYIYWQENKLNIRIFESCENMNELASHFELALRECGEQWILWHFSSVFYFNDGGRADAWRD